MKICKYCGWENPDDALFCRNCGKKFQKDGNRRGHALKYIFWRVFGLALGVGVAAAGFWLWDYFTQPTFIQVEGEMEHAITALPVESEIRLAVSTDADSYQVEFP